MMPRGVLALLLLALPLSQPAVARGRRKAARAGTVVVRSSSTGAEVWIDGQHVGDVPMALPLALRPGPHTIKVSLAGHADFLDSFSVKSGKDRVLEIDLLPVAGVLRASARPPEAIVVVDGRQVGSVPYQGELEPGKRVVELRAAGHGAQRSDLEVEAGQVYAIDATLIPLPAPEAMGPTPWYGEWWVWAGAAAVVAAGVTVALVVSGDDAPPDPPYIITLEPQR